METLKKLKYELWISKEGYDDPQKALQQCLEATEKMVKEFPELRVAKGVVWSKTNPDNFHPKFFKQYEHAWCVTPEGEVVDPTVDQYVLIGKVEYKEFDLSKPISKCKGCGQYFEGKGVVCGECGYTEEDIW